MKWPGTDERLFDNVIFVKIKNHLCKLTPNIEVIVLFCFPSNIGGFTGIPAWILHLGTVHLTDRNKSRGLLTTHNCILIFVKEVNCKTNFKIGGTTKTSLRRELEAASRPTLTHQSTTLSSLNSDGTLSKLPSDKTVSPGFLNSGRPSLRQERVGGGMASLWHCSSTGRPSITVAFTSSPLMFGGTVADRETSYWQGFLCLRCWYWYLGVKHFRIWYIFKNVNDSSGVIFIPLWQRNVIEAWCFNSLSINLKPIIINKTRIKPNVWSLKKKINMNLLM